MKEEFDLLARMRELHIPEPVTWWPPAPGWWILALLIVAVGVSVGLWVRRRTAIRRAALGVLRQIRRDYALHHDPRRLAGELSILLRRTVLGLTPRQEVAGLTGAAWLRFLDGASGGDEFTRGCGRLLTTLPYTRSAVADEEAHGLLELVERWIRRVA